VTRTEDNNQQATENFEKMVQSLNTKALLTLASVVRRPSLMVPHVSLHNVSQLNYTALKESCGVRAVVFDKDNTLTAPYGMTIHPDACRGLEDAKSVFGIANVAIMSNSAGTLDDPDYEDAKRIEEALGIPVIRHDEKKPGGLDEVLSHFKLEDPAHLCMVGDRLLTDVVFGNLYGMLTVHTLPLCSGSDNVQDNKIASLVRRAENKGLYGNWFGGRRLLNSKPGHKYWQGEEVSPLRLSVEEPPSSE
jgi:phosphatidylglycerophosphatase GEP4